jgi:glycosyltransferase involved in cell wall biosynthesis
MEYFSTDLTVLGSELMKQLPEDASVLNLHWIAGVVPLGNLFESARPIVWTLHDMNPFTGGCHYSNGCEKFQSGCGQCPQLGEEHVKDVSWSAHRRKARAYSRKQSLHIVTPSEWLGQQCRTSALLGAREVHVIPYGLDVTCFQPRGTQLARTGLNIPLNAKVVLFCAGMLTNPRKGIAELMLALGQLRDVPDLLLLSIGDGNIDIPGLAYVNLGAISDDDRLSLAYSAADVFVVPSLADNLPNTVLEAMACGTPSVGFAAGGIPEMISNGVTGYTVTVGDVHALAERIRVLLHNDTHRRDLSKNCRRRAVTDYALDVQARRYRNVYSRVLAS